MDANDVAILIMGILLFAIGLYTVATNTGLVSISGAVCNSVGIVLIIKGYMGITDLDV